MLLLMVMVVVAFSCYCRVVGIVAFAVVFVGFFLSFLLMASLGPLPQILFTFPW